MHLLYRGRMDRCLCRDIRNNKCGKLAWFIKIGGDGKGSSIYVPKEVLQRFLNHCFCGKIENNNRWAPYSVNQKTEQSRASFYVAMLLERIKQ